MTSASQYTSGFAQAAFDDVDAVASVDTRCLNRINMATAQILPSGSCSGLKEVGMILT